MIKKTYVVVLVVGQDRVHLHTNQAASFVGPGAGNVTHRVAAATKHESRQIKAPHVINAVGMAAHAQVEATQAIARETVATALEDNGLGLVVLHDSRDDGLENGFVSDVINTIAQGKVDGVILARTDADVAELASAGKVLAVLVKRDRHDAIGRVKRLLNSVAVMDVDVNVKDALLEPQKLENCQHNVCRQRRVSEPEPASQ